MTSSANSLSSHSESGKDEQQNHSQLSIQPQPSTCPLEMGASSTQFMMHQGHLDMGQNVVQSAYPFMESYYGSIVTTFHEGQHTVHPYFVGVQPGLPLPSDAVEEPVYVNAKQYHGILRRRQLRAKAESENKLIKSRKPYLHESRHLHALKRARGCGGRFLTTKNDGKNDKSSEGEGQTSNSPCPKKQQNTGSSNHSTYSSTGLPRTMDSCLKNEVKGASGRDGEKISGNGNSGGSPSRYTS